MNVDNAPPVNPDGLTEADRCDPCPSSRVFDSYSPVVATGTWRDGEPLPLVTLPDGRYFVTILSGTAVAGDDKPDDLEIRNGGLHKLNGVHFTMPHATGTVQVHLDADPLPSSQITIQVFEDNWPLNAAWDIGTERAPGARDLNNDGVIDEADRFRAVLSDSLGGVTTDVFGNPLCSEYDAAGELILGTGGACYSDETGLIHIKNIAPNKYGIEVVPPVGAGWFQTTTIEGSKTIDAWVQEGNTPYLPEEIGGQSYHIFHGFVKPCTFGDAADRCTTNDTAGAGTIHGQVKKLVPARPPFVIQDGVGEVVKYPWVALNNLSGNNELVALVRGDETGAFTITGVPDGLYQAVVWDDPQDYIISLWAVAMPQLTPDGAGGFTENRSVELKDPRLGVLPIPDWWGRLHGMVYLDWNENGVQDDPGTEKGLPGEYVEVRHRDGSLLYSTVTDATGHYMFREFFPFGHFMVAGVGYTRFGGTGANVVAGEGQLELGQPPVEARTDLGPVLTMTLKNLEGDVNRIDWGKKPYPLTADGYTQVINGGISGSIWYATTRNEEDIRWAAAADWEPGVPAVTVNLYAPVLDAQGNLVMDPSTGGARKGRWMGMVTTDDFTSSKPTDCSVLDATGFPTTDPDCREIFSTWNQVRPGVYDGAYQFFYDCSDPNNPQVLKDPENAADPCVPLPAGTYLVEVVAPDGFLHLTSNDRNVIDAGDEFLRALREPAHCVGPTYLVEDRDNPYVGTMVNRCDVKAVTVAANGNAPADFRIFTEVPIPARMKGFVNDNINLEANIGIPQFGDKTGVANLPVSIKDFKGHEIARVYTDSNGYFETLLPSSQRVNVPTPSGVSPNVVLVYANDPGTAANPDPHFNVAYNTLVMVFELFPGKTVYPDMALTPLNGFLANKTIDCGPGADTPQIASVSQPYGDNLGASSITINGAGFGASGPGSKVTLNGVDVGYSAWSDTLIDFTIPATMPAGPAQLLVTADNGKTSPTGITIHVTGPGYSPTFVFAGSNLQLAIDGAAPGSVVLVPPGIYRQNPIVWKPITLQGYGPSASIIDGAFLDQINSPFWTNQMLNLIATNQIDVVAGQPIENILATVTVVAQDGAGGNVHIDGLTIQGARVGGGIHVNSFAHNTEISNNRIQNNFGQFTGGIGLGFPNRGNNQINTPRIHHNRITHNGTLGDAGGIGVFHGVNGYQIDHNIICANGTMTAGGGISHLGTNLGAQANIDHNDILFNWAFINGGGISLQGPPPATPADPSPGTGSVAIDTNRIQGNFANEDGGGVELRAIGTHEVRVVNNMIVNNVSAEQGGGLSVRDSANLTIVNNTIAKNTSTSTSAALILEPGPHAAGMVIYPNTTPFQGSLPPGAKEISDPYLFNNIFWDNQAYVWDALAQVLFPTGPFDLAAYLSTEQLSYARNNLFTTLPAAVDSDAHNQVGAHPLFLSEYDTALTGIPVRAAGEVAINPLAVPVTVLFEPLAPLGDYHINGNSPAIEYGAFGIAGASAGQVIVAPGVDFDAQARPINACVDSGADETALTGLPRPCEVHPMADAGTAVAGVEGTAVTFDASGSIPSGFISSYTWNFGDGSPLEILATPFASHTYQDDGVYTVTLTVTVLSGLADSATTTATIANLPPLVNAGPDVVVLAGVAHTFSATANDPSPIDQSTLQYEWTFGDGGTAAGTLTPTHTYFFNLLQDTYTVTFTATDKDGGAASDTLTVTVDAAPVIYSTAVNRAVVDFPYSYQVRALDLDNDPLTYTVLLGPTWLSINPATGELSGTPGAADIGDSTVMVQVSDGLIGVDTQLFTLSVVGDAIFADSFETGTINGPVSSVIPQWGGVVGQNAAQTNLTIRDALHPTVGTKGLQLKVGNNRYLVDATPDAEPFYRARFFFDPNGSTMGSAAAPQTIFAGVTAAGNEIFRVQVAMISAGNYQIRSQVRWGSFPLGFYTSSPWVPLTNDVHTIEVAWTASTDVLTGDGSLSLFLDGNTAAPIGLLLGINNAPQRVDAARLGVVGTTGAAGGTQHFDDFVSVRRSAIGTTMLQERFDGTTINAARWTETDPSNFLTQSGQIVWTSGSTAAARQGLLDGKFQVDGDFDARIEMRLPRWQNPLTTGAQQTFRLIAASATPGGLPDTSHQLTIGRTRVRNGFNGFESIRTEGGVSSTAQVLSGLNNTFLRFVRTGGTFVTAYYWDGTTWILLNTATLPAGPVVFSLDGQVTAGVAAIRVEMDTLKVTAGTLP
ncbi:MAG: PKD domain-containing protein [Nitrospirota bacterium]